MRRGFIIAVVICAAVGLGFFWLIQNSEWIEIKVPGFMSGPALEDPFYAATRLVERLGGRSESVHTLIGMPPTDAVLVVNRWSWGTSGKGPALKKWVADGGRLVLDSSVDLAQLQAWTHLRLSYPFTKGLTEDATEDPTEVAERFKPCRSMRVITSPAADRESGAPWKVCNLSPIRRLLPPSGPSWGVGDEHGLQAVRMQYGKGFIFYADGTPFTYRALIDEDDARLLVDGAQLRHGDVVYFLHFAEPDSLMVLVWRQAAAALCLLALAVVLYAWRSGTRLWPLLPPPEPARRSLVEQIRGTAQFLRQAGEANALHAATLSALESVGQRKLAGFGRLTAEERLQLIARRTGLDPERLRTARFWRDSRGSDGLAESILLLEAARRRLISGTTI
jgi:hypothetical protein